MNTVTTNQGLGWNQYITTTVERIDGNDVYLTPVETEFEINWDIPFSKSELILEGNSIESIVVKPVQPKLYTEEEVNSILKYIDKLETSSFEGWSKDSKNGYLTACCSIKKKLENL